MFQYSLRVSASPREPFSFALPLRSPISPAAGRFDHEGVACFELCAAGGGEHFDAAVGAFDPVAAGCGVGAAREAIWRALAAVDRQGCGWGQSVAGRGDFG